MIDTLRKMRGQKGFTLLELLVVVAIIAILATLILANLNRARKQAQDAKVQSEVKSVSDAIQLYQTSNFDNPALIAALQSLAPIDVNNANPGVLAPLQTPPDPLLKTFPAHPVSGSFYRYKASAASGTLSYTVCGNLINAAPASYSITDGVATKNAGNCASIGL